MGGWGASGRDPAGNARRVNRRGRIGKANARRRRVGHFQPLSNTKPSFTASQKPRKGQVRLYQSEAAASLAAEPRAARATRARARAERIIVVSLLSVSCLQSGRRRHTKRGGVVTVGAEKVVSSRDAHDCAWAVLGTVHHATPAAAFGIDGQSALVKNGRVRSYTYTLRACVLTGAQSREGGVDEQTACTEGNPPKAASGNAHALCFRCGCSWCVSLRVSILRGPSRNVHPGWVYTAPAPVLGAALLRSYLRTGQRYERYGL